MAGKLSRLLTHLGTGAGAKHPAPLVAHDNGLNGLFEDRAGQLLGGGDLLVAFLLAQIGQHEAIRIYAVVAHVRGRKIDGHHVPRLVYY